jgi:hypothetical protein
MMGAPAARDEMIDLARRAWGEENKALSKRDEMRWGNNGSKSIDLKKLCWFDHEAGSGGYRDLYKLVHGHYPPNGGDDGIAATYDYRDENGALLFQVVRKVPKKFVQRRPNGSGGWIWNLDGVRRVLYRDGQCLVDDRGKRKYTPVVEVPDREVRERISTAVVALVRRHHPEALSS